MFLYVSSFLEEGDSGLDFTCQSLLIRPGLDADETQMGCVSSLRNLSTLAFGDNPLATWKENDTQARLLLTEIASSTL